VWRAHPSATHKPRVQAAGLRASVRVSLDNASATALAAPTEDICTGLLPRCLRPLQGKGIFLIHRLSQIKQWNVGSLPPAMRSGADSYVVSRYIGDPLLVRGPAPRSRHVNARRGQQGA
jgi:hypothetical protein